MRHRYRQAWHEVTDGKDQELYFGVLGPVRVVRGGTELGLGGLRTRALLAMLIASWGEAVSLDDLIAAVWDDPPPTARRQVRNRISELRDLFRRFDLPPDLIRNAGTGYALWHGQHTSDAKRFEACLAASAADLAEGNLVAARSQLDAALNQWRGKAFEGLPMTQPLEAIANWLSEKRHAARESLLDITLQLGEHQRVIPELQKLIVDHPWRERPVSLLMTALYRSSRQREALEAFDALAERLAADLGIDPSPPLTELRNQILRQDRALMGLAAPQSKPPMRAVWTLPAPLADFTGRQIELQKITEHMQANLSVDRAPVVALSGLPGIGKTATATIALYRFRNEIPFGQLYVDLHGHAQPLDPAAVIRRFLRQLGFGKDEVPDDIDDATTLYRAVLSERPRLVLLDNAANAHQVRLLLPPPECPTIITSRPMLSDLDGAFFLPLEPMPQADALDLISQVVGRDSVAEQLDAAISITRSCGRLPLALRIAAAQAITSRAPLAELSAALRDRGRILDHLTTAERSVRATLSSGFESLGKAEQGLLIEIALSTEDDFPQWIAQTITGESALLAAARLSRLAEAGFVEPAGVDVLGQSRFRVHDLVRHFALEEAVKMSRQTRRDSLSRLAEDWHTLAEQADKALHHSGFFTAALSTATTSARIKAHLEDPGQWFSVEHRGLLNLIRQAASVGLNRQCWTLMWHSETFLTRDGRDRELLEHAALALDCARAAEDRLGIACASLMLAAAHSRLAELPSASAYAAQALTAAEQTTNAWLVAEVLAVQAQILGRQCDPAGQHAALMRCIPLYLQVGEEVSAGERLVQLGEITLGADPVKAIDLLDQGIDLLRRNPATVPLARSLRKLASIHVSRDNAPEAAKLLTECLDLLSKVNDPVGELCVHTDVAILHADLGSLPEAIVHIDLAKTFASRVSGPQYLGYVDLGMGIVLARKGDSGAEGVLTMAVEGLETLPALKARALLELGAIHLASGRQSGAGLINDALGLAEQTGATVTAAHARQLLGEMPTIAKAPGRAVQ